MPRRNFIHTEPTFYEPKPETLALAADVRAAQKAKMDYAEAVGKLEQELASCKRALAEAEADIERIGKSWTARGLRAATVAEVALGDDGLPRGAGESTEDYEEREMLAACAELRRLRRAIRYGD